MEWFNPAEKLPEIIKGKATRCLGYCTVENGLIPWTGFLDIFFDPYRGWYRCEESLCINKSVFFVIKWSKELEKPIDL